MQPGEQELEENISGLGAAVVQRLLELKKSGEPLPESDDLLNPYASIARTMVHQQADELKNNREKIEPI